MASNALSNLIEIPIHHSLVPPRWNEIRWRNAFAILANIEFSIKIVGTFCVHCVLMGWRELGMLSSPCYGVWSHDMLSRKYFFRKKFMFNDYDTMARTNRQEKGRKRKIGRETTSKHIQSEMNKIKLMDWLTDRPTKSSNCIQATHARRHSNIRFDYIRFCANYINACIQLQCSRT